MGNKEEKKKLAALKKTVTETQEQRKARMGRTDGGRTERPQIVPKQNKIKLAEIRNRELNRARRGDIDG